MGEIIRNIQEISLANGKVMVELNEGYTKEQGRLIHLQNDKFRYVLTVKDFFVAAASILRAEAEIDYTKSHYEVGKESSPPPECKSKIGDFKMVFILQREKIRYRVVQMKNRLLTIIVHPQDRSRFIGALKTNHIKFLEHPYSIQNGYVFLYQMRPFEIYKDGNVFVEVFYQLPCASLTPKNWVPLDKIIQRTIWETADEIDGVLWLDKENKWIYQMADCLFRRKNFPAWLRTFFEQDRELLKQQSLREKLQYVVFKFTDVLLQDITDGDYDLIVKHYYEFTNY